MDALALVVSTAILSGILIVILRVGRRRAAAVRWKTLRWAPQQADLELEAIPPRRRHVFRTAVLPMLVGIVIGGVIALGTYLYVAYKSPPALLLGLGVVLLVAARLRRTRPALAANDAGEEPNP